MNKDIKQYMNKTNEQIKKAKENPEKSNKEVKEALLEMGTISEILVEESKFHITPKEAIEDIRKLNVGDNYFIIKQAFEDMKEERKQRDETEQSLSKWIVELQTEIKEATNIQADSYKWINELQAKLDKIKEVIPKVINGLLGYEIDLNIVIPILEKIIKEE